MLVKVVEMAQTDPSKLPTTTTPSSLGYDESMSATTCPEKAKAYLNEKLDWFCPCGCGMSAWTRMAMCPCYEYDYPEGATRDFRTLRRKRVTSESEYILGVSLTHGPPGNRSRIWSFVAAYFKHSSYTKSTCPCKNTEVQ